jgi:protein-disulfide isomerase
VRGTPTFIIGGEMVAGGLEYAQFNEVLERIAGSGRGGEVRQ